MQNIPKLTGHNESAAEKNVHRTKCLCKPIWSLASSLIAHLKGLDQEEPNDPICADDRNDQIGGKNQYNRNTLEWWKESMEKGAGSLRKQTR